jgi:hypothetical protein
MPTHSPLPLKLLFSALSYIRQYNQPFWDIIAKSHIDSVLVSFLGSLGFPVSPGQSISKTPPTYSRNELERGKKARTVPYISIKCSDAEAATTPALLEAASVSRAEWSNCYIECHWSRHRWAPKSCTLRFKTGTEAIITAGVVARVPPMPRIRENLSSSFSA